MSPSTREHDVVDEPGLADLRRDRQHDLAVEPVDRLERVGVAHLGVLERHERLGRRRSPAPASRSHGRSRSPSPTASAAARERLGQHPGRGALVVA